jgi:hypothetical protein
MVNKAKKVIAKPQFSLGSKTDENTYVTFKNRAKSQKTTVSKILQNIYAKNILEWESEESLGPQDAKSANRITIKTPHHFSSQQQSQTSTKDYHTDMQSAKKALKSHYDKSKEIEMWGDAGKLLAIISIALFKK